MAVYSTEGRAVIFHTACLNPKSTRSTQGVNIMTLKPKWRVESALPLDQTPICLLYTSFHWRKAQAPARIRP